MKHDKDNWLQFHKYDENYKRRTIKIHVGDDDDDDDGDGGGKCVCLMKLSLSVSYTLWAARRLLVSKNECSLRKWNVLDVFIVNLACWWNTIWVKSLIANANTICLTTH